MCKTRLDTKIHPRLRPRMQSSRTIGESSSTQPQVQDSGQPEDAWAAKPEGARFGATRRSIHRRRRSEALGQPGDSPSAEPEDAGFGATRSLIRRRHWRSVDPGQLGCLPPMPLKDASQEATQDSVAGEAGRCRVRGNPKPHRKAALEERRLGATRSFSADAAEGCEIRGNSNVHRRHGRKMQDSGQPGTSSEGVIGGAGSGATRSFAAGSAKGCEIRGNSKIRRRQCLKRQVSRRLGA